MADAQKVLANQVSDKRADGSFTDPLPFGVTFENVIDTREDGSKRTLAQFYDNYIAFINQAPFIYYGDTQPENPHIKLWIDTAHDNQYGIIPEVTLNLNSNGSFGGKNFSDFGNYTLQSNTITGKAFKIDNYVEFNTTNSAEQSGYYLAIEVNPWEDVKMRSSRKPDNWVPTSGDGIYVIFLGSTAPNEVEWIEIQEESGLISKYNVNITSGE